MKWEDIKDSNPDTFKRLVGVRKDLFERMVRESDRLSAPSTHKVAGKKRGPKPKLSMENRVLMLLMYYREYRTFLHIATTFGISEPQCWRIITQLECLLIKSGLFHVKGKKKLLEDNNIEVVLVDVTESPIERPKKNKKSTIPARKNDTP